MFHVKLNTMKISVNVRLYSYEDFVMGDTSTRALRHLEVDVTKVEQVQPVDCGYAVRTLDVVRPISEMLRTFCSSSQFLAVLETLSYTVRESLIRNADWFHSTAYEDFEVNVETKFLPDYV